MPTLCCLVRGCSSMEMHCVGHDLRVIKATQSAVIFEMFSSSNSSEQGLCHSSRIQQAGATAQSWKRKTQCSIVSPV